MTRLGWIMLLTFAIVIGAFALIEGGILIAFALRLRTYGQATH